MHSEGLDNDQLDGFNQEGEWEREKLKVNLTEECEDKSPEKEELEQDIPHK
jgi:hypothetical protein